jgi:hypothetical protein
MDAFGRGCGLHGLHLVLVSRDRAGATSRCDSFPRNSEQIYVAKGFNKEEAAAVIGTLTRKREYHDYFVDHMMVQARWEKQSRRGQQASGAGGRRRCESRTGSAGRGGRPGD